MTVAKGHGNFMATGITLLQSINLQELQELINAIIVL